jgi:NADPH2:quinone reductase
VTALVDPDAFADFALADAAWLARVPEGLGPGPASLLTVAAPVALRVLRTGRLAEGENVLVHSAVGNIGALAVQLAKLLGAGTVIATASTKKKLEYARALGADVVVDYTAEDWPEQVRAAAPTGVDLLLDAVGGATLTSGIDLLAPLGRAVVYGAASGELISLPIRSLFGLKTVVGFSLLAWRAARPAQAREEMTEVAQYLSDGRLRTHVQATLPLTEAAEAHRLLEDRSTIGRILLTP